MPATTPERRRRRVRPPTASARSPRPRACRRAPRRPLRPPPLPLGRPRRTSPLLGACKRARRHAWKRPRRCAHATPGGVPAAAPARRDRVRAAAAALAPRRRVRRLTRSSRPPLHPSPRCHHARRPRHHTPGALPSLSRCHHTRVPALPRPFTASVRLPLRCHRRAAAPAVESAGSAAVFALPPPPPCPGAHPPLCPRCRYRPRTATTAPAITPGSAPTGRIRLPRLPTASAPAAALPPPRGRARHRVCCVRRSIRAAALAGTPGSSSVAVSALTLPPPRRAAAPASRCHYARAPAITLGSALRSLPCPRPGVSRCRARVATTPRCRRCAFVRAAVRLPLGCRGRGLLSRLVLVLLGRLASCLGARSLARWHPGGGCNWGVAECSWQSVRRGCGGGAPGDRPACKGVGEPPGSWAVQRIVCGTWS